VWKVSFQFRAMNVVGEILSVWGKVSAKRNEAAYGLGDIDLGITNDAGKESTPGKATLAIPYLGGKALPYPFVPPQS